MFQLPALPYAMEALQPHISKETLEYHYGKHHKAYVDNLNKLVQNTGFANATLEEIIMKASGPIFNNAAQDWNHTFYWHCLTPKSAAEPSGKLADAIKKTFNSVDEFKKLFSQAAISVFGSGWAWLVKNSQGELEIITTSNGGLPMKEGKKALLTCDVWEHAYYIDYRNLRPSYVENFWKLVNWDFVADNFK
ncbi:MAG TPA: Fe-Mn family superoxide dismutase [Gammaproteobacteria bacterium]|jgi:Fe-Mn family superoxide dismutase|nr:Fe-Mn family superoxide dismutase [Gammaproteobacteria bacterium]